MSMQDPIADMLTRIRNGQQANHQHVEMISSSLKAEIARVLKEEGYIADYHIDSSAEHLKTLTIKLKYYHGRPVIEKLKRVSRPGLRVYKAVNELAPIPGFGVAILSTSQGVMSHSLARKNGVGGEVICEVA